MLRGMRRFASLVGLGLLLHCSADGGETAGPGGFGGSGASGAVGGSAGSAGSGGSGASSGSAGSGAAGTGGVILTDAGGCTPTTTLETACNGVDDDCNGKIDDVDVGKDGICDCLRIGIVGNPGSNPSANFQGWLTARGTSVQRTHTAATELFDAALVDQFDVLIFDQLPRDYTSAEAEVLRVWVEAGGGFVSMTGYTDSAPDFRANALLQPFGLSYSPGLHSEPVTIFATHPVTVGLTSVTFLGGYLVADAGGAGGSSVVIGSISAGPVAYAHERGKGRAVVWGDEWIEYDSEWQTLPEIENLWVNLMSWLGPQDSCSVEVPR